MPSKPYKDKLSLKEMYVWSNASLERSSSDVGGRSFGMGGASPLHSNRAEAIGPLNTTPLTHSCSVIS